VIEDAMNNPFCETTTLEIPDEELVTRAQNGDWRSFEELIQRHQAWIFNIAVRMVGWREDAEDVTQEVLLKVLTRLSTFQGKSRFRTWLYRIVVNHVLNLKLRPGEISFSELGQQIDQIPDQRLPDPSEAELPASVLIEEAKVSCTMGMLLCLDRRQRLVYILGEIFKVNSEMGAELMALSPANFRQLLSRARHDLSNYMHNKCGLINQANPCRCARKTRSFIELGVVDPARCQFTHEHLGQVSAIAPERTKALHNLLEEQSAGIYREHPFLVPVDQGRTLRTLLNQPAFKQIFTLD
jgi:RNA polymerase sigma factor (sigma-70 family)